MSIEVYGLTVLDGIMCAGGLQSGPVVLGNVLLSTDKTLITEYMTKARRDVLGLAIVEGFERAAASEFYPVYALYADKNADPEDEITALDRVKRRTYASVMPFTVALWLIRDFSVSLGMCISCSCEKGNKISRLTNIDDVGIVSCNARGELDLTTFSEVEIRAAAVNCGAAIDRVQVVAGRKKFTRSLSAFDRLNRAWHMLLAARSEHVLSYRVLHYMIVMEMLLLRDNDELSHRVSERAAVRLAQEGRDRQHIYHRVKEAYAERSHFVHGGAKKRDDEFWIALSCDCDEFLRKLMSMKDGKCAYPELFDIEDNKAFNDYFLNLLFPSLPTDPGTTGQH